MVIFQNPEKPNQGIENTQPSLPASFHPSSEQTSSPLHRSQNHSSPLSHELSVEDRLTNASTNELTSLFLQAVGAIKGCSTTSPHQPVTLDDFQLALRSSIDRGEGASREFINNVMHALDLVYQQVHDLAEERATFSGEFHWIERVSAFTQYLLPVVSSKHPEILDSHKPHIVAGQAKLFEEVLLSRAQSRHLLQRNSIAHASLDLLSTYANRTLEQHSCDSLNQSTATRDMISHTLPRLASNSVSGLQVTSKDGGLLLRTLLRISKAERSAEIMPALELSYDAVLKQLVSLGEPKEEEPAESPLAADLYNGYVLCVEAMAHCATSLQQAPFFQSIANRGLQYREGKAAVTALLLLDQELAKPYIEEILKSVAANSRDDLQYVIEILGIPGTPSFIASTLVNSTAAISPVVQFLNNRVDHSPNLLPTNAKKNLRMFAEALDQCSH